MKQTKTLKTKTDFYKFFQAIPNEKWCTGSFNGHGRYCALGHLGLRNSDEDFTLPNIQNLKKLGGSTDQIISINDNKGLGGTIKERVLNYVKSL